jgi:hypothetical protein
MTLRQPTYDSAFMAEIHRRMLRIRRLDEVAVELAKTGEVIGSLHTSTNQEAAVVGATAAPDDQTSARRVVFQELPEHSEINGAIAERIAGNRHALPRKFHQPCRIVRNEYRGRGGAGTPHDFG